MVWVVTTNKKVKKQDRKLPQRIKAALYVLIAEIKDTGPARGNWKWIQLRLGWLVFYLILKF